MQMRVHSGFAVKLDTEQPKYIRFIGGGGAPDPFGTPRSARRERIEFLWDQLWIHETSLNPNGS